MVAAMSEQLFDDIVNEPHFTNTIFAHVRLGHTSLEDLFSSHRTAEAQLTVKVPVCSRLHLKPALVALLIACLLNLLFFSATLLSSCSSPSPLSLFPPPLTQHRVFLPLCSCLSTR